MVETRVTTSIEEFGRADEKRESYEITITSEVKTDLSLKGISVSERWADNREGVFYSLILLPREEYVAILERNVAEELSLQRTRIKQAREEQRLETEKEAAILEKERDQKLIEAERKRIVEEEKLRQEELKRLARERLKLKYREFLASQPQAQMISFRNANISHRVQHYALSLGIMPGIAPFDASELFGRFHLGYRLLKVFDISSTTFFRNQANEFNWGYQDIDLKLRILNSVGDLVPFTLGFGAKGIFFNPLYVFNSSQEVGVFGSLYAAATLSVPMLLYSHFSLYAGLDKISFGIVSHPLFGWIGDAIGLLLEAHYYIESRLVREGLGRFLFQAGVRFHSEQFAATFAFEDYSRINLGIDLYF